MTWASVRPSVRHTAVLCQNGAKITKSSLWAVPKTLVYRNKISCQFRVRGGGPFEQGHQKGVPPLKRRYFAGIDSPSVKTVADRY